MHNYATYCYNVLQRLISQINQVLQVSNTNIPSIYIWIHVLDVHHTIIDLCLKYSWVQIFAIYFYIPILCKMHFHVALKICLLISKDYFT